VATNDLVTLAIRTFVRRVVGSFLLEVRVPARPLPQLVAHPHRSGMPAMPVAVITWSNSASSFGVVVASRANGVAGTPPVPVGPEVAEQADGGAGEAQAARRPPTPPSAPAPSTVRGVGAHPDSGRSAGVPRAGLIPRR
jgi:hypothetical protein